MINHTWENPSAESYVLRRNSIYGIGDQQSANSLKYIMYYIFQENNEIVYKQKSVIR